MSRESAALAGRRTTGRSLLTIPWVSGHLDGCGTGQNAPYLVNLTTLRPCLRLTGWLVEAADAAVGPTTLEGGDLSTLAPLALGMQSRAIRVVVTARPQARLHSPTAASSA